MATIPIHNPQLPFLGLIPGGLRPGKMLRFRGVVHQEGRIQINIQCGAATEPRDNVGLHLSIRPKENVIVRNHYQNFTWGPEERYGHSPIYFGQPFDILVLAEYSQYKIAVNGNHFCTFGHRIPLEKMSFVSISGHGAINYIGLEHENTGGSSVPTAPPISNLPNYPQVYPTPPAPPPMPPYPIGPTYPPHGGVPVYPGMPGMGGAPPPPPPYTPSPYPGGNISSTTSTYPTSTDPYSPYHNPVSSTPKQSKSLIKDTKSFINNIIGNKTNNNTPTYPTQNVYQQNPPYQGYPMQPGIPNQPQYYPTAPYGATGQTNSGSNMNKGILGALGGGTAAGLLSGAALMGGKKKKKKNKALKYAAGAGAIGLGGYALHKALKKRGSSSSSSSSSD